jgi:predicted dehydrogenase
MIKIAIIGYGYWGPNLVRNFNGCGTAKVVAVSDLREERLRQVSTTYPSIKTVLDYRELLKDPAIDAVAIATPVSTHYELALQALTAGKHVLLEKPFTSTSAQASHLIEEADRRGLTLMVDHTYLYTPAVRKIKELVTSGDLGKLYYYDSVRVNLGLFQHDVNVLWDLAVHDLSIMDYILGETPKAVAATGVAHVEGQPEDVAYLSCYFDNNVIAHFHVNWLAPVKIRRTLIGGSSKMIVYDDLEPSEKIKIYDKGITLNEPEGVYKMLVGYRTGDMWAPQLSTTEALKAEAQHFVECIESGAPPLTGAAAGLSIVRILEAATESIQKSGQPIELKETV